MTLNNLKHFTGDPLNFPETQEIPWNTMEKPRLEMKQNNGQFMPD